MKSPVPHLAARRSLSSRQQPGRRPAFFAALALSALLASGAAVAHAANNPGTGDTGFFTFRPAAVAGTQINVASGNALIRTRDLTDGLLTYHVVVDRAYNSLAPNDFSILSPRWKFDVGPDTKLAVESNQDATVTGPSGYRIRFERQSDGSYVAPAGFDGSLTKTATGWTLTRTSQNDEFGFDGSGNLAWTKDAELRDFTVQGTSAAGRTVLSSYGTNSGRRVNLSYNGDSLVRLMDDPASGHHSYRYTSGKLTEYESPTGAKTTYDYDSNGFLNKIVEPGGTTVELDVLPSGKINAITTTLPGGVPQTTGFVYTRRTYKSDVIAPDGVRRTYAYDDDWRVTRQYNPDEIPAVSASGELKDLEGGYVGPNRTYPVTVAATQPDGAGLRRLWLTLIPENELAGQNVPCTTTPFDLVCPQTYDVPLDIDFAPLPEGPTTVRGAARDDEQNRGNSTAWEVTVDKTAPIDVTPSGELFDLQDGYINGQGTKTLTASALDPDMANGTRLSGIKRFQLEDIGNGTIATTDVACTTLACPVTATETLNVDTTQMAGGAHQLRIVATDLVGNVTHSDPWTVLVDRTGPTAPHSLATDFDEDEATAYLSWDADDPDLVDGSPGSGIGGYEISYTIGGTTKQTTSEAPSIELENAQVGDQVSVAVKGLDTVGNAGATTTQTLNIAALPNCDTSAPGSDPVPAGLLPGTRTEQADLFIFNTPVAPSDLLTALPPGARVVSVLDRDPSPAAEHTSGMLIPTGYSAASALAYWSSTLYEDLNAEEDELIAARDNSDLPAYVAEVDRQLAQIQTRRQRMSAAAGVPIRAFSVVHDPSVAAALTSTFAGNLTTAATVLPTADCDGTNGEALDGEETARTSSGRSAARAIEPDLPHSQEVKDYTMNDYAPPFIRVRTETGLPYGKNKITAAWKYVAVRNLSYWRSKYRRTGTQRGAEIQVDLNRDHDSRPFGYPWWYTNPIHPGPAPDDEQNPTPKVWNANYRCAYPDDYFGDKRPYLSVTIGMYCRPNNIHKRYRWAHYVSSGEDHDEVTVSVMPNHYAKSNHAGARLPGIGDISERAYCDQVGKRFGSCMFSDHGPVPRRYSAPGGADTVSTPSNVVFARKKGN